MCTRDPTCPATPHLTLGVRLVRLRAASIMYRASGSCEYCKAKPGPCNGANPVPGCYGVRLALTPCLIAVPPLSQCQTRGGVRESWAPRCCIGMLQASTAAEPQVHGRTCSERRSVCWRLHGLYGHRWGARGHTFLVCVGARFANSGKLVEAKATLEEALALDADHENARKYLRIVHSQIQAKEAASTKPSLPTATDTAATALRAADMLPKRAIDIVRASQPTNQSARLLSLIVRGVVLCHARLPMRLTHGRTSSPNAWVRPFPATTQAVATLTVRQKIAASADAAAAAAAAAARATYPMVRLIAEPAGHGHGRGEGATRGGARARAHTRRGTTASTRNRRNHTSTRRGAAAISHHENPSASHGLGRTGGQVAALLAAAVAVTVAMTAAGLECRWKALQQAMMRRHTPFCSESVACGREGRGVWL